MAVKLKSIRWAFSLAWKFNKAMLVSWLLLVSAVSVLPAVAVRYNREIIEQLSRFISTGNGSFNEILPTIIIFGLITAAIGFSNRLNIDLIYMMMFDSYYFGMENFLMDSYQSFSAEELMKKDAKDEFHYAAIREGSLTDFLSGFCSLFGKLVGIVSLLVVAFSMSKLLFTISSVYVVGIIWLNMSYVEKQRFNWNKIRDKERLAAHYENMPCQPDAAKELRVFKSKEKLLANWREAYSPLYDFQIKNSLSIELRTFISGLGFYIFLFAMIMYSIFAVYNQTMAPETLLVIFTLCLNIFTSISGVAKNFMNADHGLYALERQYTMFGCRTVETGESPITYNENTSDTDTVFETKDLTYCYKDNIPALKNVSVTIKKGQTIALVGANGSGKSTLVKLLLRLYRPSSGKLYFYGQDYESLQKSFLQNKIGAFFQDYYLFHMPVSENVGFGDIANINDSEKISNALVKGGAAGFIGKLKKGVQTYIYKWIEETGADFSGGEKQKIAVSRAHMSDKDILIFDEPASMLDPISELEQFTNIREKLEGRTAILISHRVGFARLADKIILLNNGEVAETGTHDELLQKNGLYACFFNEQAMWYRQEVNDVEL